MEDRMTYTITSRDGNRAVVITSNDDAGPFRCRLWVNTRQNGLPQADATLTTATRKNMGGKRGAIAWAYRTLGLPLGGL